MLILNVLGYPRIILDDAPVEDFISSKALLLLCYLALNNRTHARDTLAGLFWGDMPESRAKSNLRQALHNLQKQLPGYFEVSRQAVSFDGQDYRLDAVLLRDSVNHDEIGLLEEAVALYEGDFLEGVQIDDAPELDEWLRSEREHYRLLYIAALDKLVSFHTARGNWPPAERFARALLEIEPWREASHRQLMLLLVRRGEYGAALAQYEICCDVLERELGVEPMAETTALYERIQQARSTPRHNLPSASEGLVGREGEITRLKEWLHSDACRLISILGVGGVGKSRLAQVITLGQVNNFLNGVRYVSLAPLTDPEFIITELAQVLGVSLSGGATPRQQILDHLQNLEMLLLFDNFEHLIEGADLVADILDHAPDVKVIVTSRERLDLQQEWMFTLEGLSVPPPDAPLDEIETHDSVRYLVQKARQRKRNFSLVGQEADIATLCRLLGGLPLGIELAAAMLPLVSGRQLIAEIEQDLDVLAVSWRNMPDRHRSLRAVFDHSWQTLSPDEQVVFPQLAVFRGGFTLDAARRVTGANLMALDGLVAKSFLSAESHDDEMRYDVHEVLRQYGFEVLDTVQETRQQVEAMHRFYYADFLNYHAEAFLPETLREALATVEAERGNLRAAWQNAIRHVDSEMIADMAEPLHKFYEGTNLFQEGSDLFGFALDNLAGELDKALYGRLLVHSAGLRLRLGRVQDAYDNAAQSVEALRSGGGDAGTLAFALNVLGVTQLYRGEFGAAKQSLLESADLYRQAGRREDLPKPLANLGSLSVRMGDYELARAVLEEGLEISEEQNNQRGVSHFLTNLGAAHQALGDYDTARSYYERVLPIVNQQAHLHVKGVVLINLGEMEFHTADGDAAMLERAIAHCQEGVDTARQIGDRRNLALGLTWLGLAYDALENTKQAASTLQECLRVALETQSGPAVAQAMMGGAALLLNHELRDRALELFAAVLGYPALEDEQRRFILSLLSNEPATIETDDEALQAIAQSLIDEVGQIAQT